MPAKLLSRRTAYSLIRKHPWIPVAMTIAAACGFALRASLYQHPFWIFGAVAVLTFCSFVWGYSAHALKDIPCPPLTHLHRSQYAEVWDALAASPSEARAAACGAPQESGVRRSALVPVTNLLELARVSSQDEVLEIGCGVGRIGFELAPHCSNWTGADISANMLSCACERLRPLRNVNLVKLSQVGLDELAADSYDLVYSTNVFAHLDEMDRWRYVKDACRVLRPGGRLFIDNVDLESDAGWAMLANDAESSQHLERPPYGPRLSTAAELGTYARRAGFGQVQLHRRAPLIILTAVKPRLEKSELHAG